MYDYSDPTIQRQVEHLTQTFENTSYMSNTLYTESWLRSFLLYADRNKDYLNITIDNKKDFIKNLKEVEYKKIFLVLLIRSLKNFSFSQSVQKL